jgi:hypothetical protein
MTREQELTRRGWQKQVTYDEPRLSEMIDMYRELGFEVRLEPFDPLQEAGCTDCMQASPERYQTIYTRKNEN